MLDIDKFNEVINYDIPSTFTASHICPQLAKCLQCNNYAYKKLFSISQRSNSLLTAGAFILLSKTSSAYLERTMNAPAVIKKLDL